jgi:ubiquinone/menaquinone biosynthesis C-methylase UbiE
MTESDISEFDPTRKFTGLARTYAKARPGYPAGALDFIIETCKLGPASLLVDVGCGTGISSRLFASQGIPVIGIEPNDDMRVQAEQQNSEASMPGLSYRAGKAEDTGLSSCTADVVLAAQAFHWFEAEPALAEFHRILKAGGWCVLVWNERDNTDQLTQAYSKLLCTLPTLDMLGEKRRDCANALLHSPLFHSATEVVFRNQQSMDEDGLLGRAFSTSYVPRDGEHAVELGESLRELFAQHRRNNTVVMKYKTYVYLACRQ